MASKRDYRLDNLKCMLIFLVVLCHLVVEFVSPRGFPSKALYQTIYVFHMPAFVFTTGYFARFRPQKILAGLVFPYVVFQVLATLFRNTVSGRAPLWGFTLLHPQWMLWYLLACSLWYCTIPLLELARTTRAQGATVAVAFAASLFCGFVPWIGDLLDLSRVVVLFPFFCSGWFAGRLRLSERVKNLRPRTLRTCRWVLVGALLVFLAAQVGFGSIPGHALYRDAPYANMREFVGRVLVQCGAVVWCALLFVAASASDLGLVSTVGSNTMSVYLLHPWAIRVLRLFPPVVGSEPVQLLCCAAASVALLALLGNNAVGRRFSFVFGGGWLKGRATSAERPAI